MSSNDGKYVISFFCGGEFVKDLGPCESYYDAKIIALRKALEFIRGNGCSDKKFNKIMTSISLLDSYHDESIYIVPPRFVVIAGGWCKFEWIIREKI